MPRAATVALFQQIIARMQRKNGCDAVVLGCTEIPLLVSTGDTALPLFDTTALHARFAADFALG